MSIKPLQSSGILTAVRGKKDYLVLSMLDGAIQFTVDNGQGPITAVFNTTTLFNGDVGLCHQFIPLNFGVYSGTRYMQ